MASNFRPVQEIWGQRSSCFVHDPAGLLKWIADFGDCGRVERTPYGDNISVWIEAGSRFLDRISDHELELAAIRDLTEGDPEAICRVCANMRALTAAWRSSLDEDGSITFYVDAW